MTYLMESQAEARRLLEQEQRAPSLSRLLAAGLAPGMRVVDVGCGAGALLPALRSVVGPDVPITAVDPSPQRLEAARALMAGDANVHFTQAALPHTALPGAAYDFVWSQFVFEYLPQPQVALAELIRLAKPGGRVAVADVDGAGADFWPEPPAVADGRPRFLEGLRAAGFDLYVGRKLYSLFKAAGLQGLGVHLGAMHLIPGRADESHLDDWRVRLEALAPAMVPAFGSQEAWSDFARAYLALLADDDSLKYGVALTTWGTRR